MPQPVSGDNASRHEPRDRRKGRKQAEVKKPARPWVLRIPSDRLHASRNLGADGKPLSHGARLLRELLEKYCQHKPFCWPCNAELANWIGVGKRSVQLYLRELHEAKYIVLVYAKATDLGTGEQTDDETDRLGIVLTKRLTFSPAADTPEREAIAVRHASAREKYMDHPDYQKLGYWCLELRIDPSELESGDDDQTDAPKIFSPEWPNGEAPGAKSCAHPVQNLTQGERRILHTPHEGSYIPPRVESFTPPHEESFARNKEKTPKHDESPKHDGLKSYPAKQDHHQLTSAKSDESRGDVVALRQGVGETALEHRNALAVDPLAKVAGLSVEDFADRLQKDRTLGEAHYREWAYRLVAAFRARSKSSRERSMLDAFVEVARLIAGGTVKAVQVIDAYSRVIDRPNLLVYGRYFGMTLTCDLIHDHDGWTFDRAKSLGLVTSHDRKRMPTPAQPARAVSRATSDYDPDDDLDDIPF